MVISNDIFAVLLRYFQNSIGNLIIINVYISVQFIDIAPEYFICSLNPRLYTVDYSAGL